MGILTIRNLDDAVHRKLRIVAAAERGLSMEEHARQALARSLKGPAGAEPETPYDAGGEEMAGQLWLKKFRAIWAAIGYADDLVIPPRASRHRHLPFLVTSRAVASR